MVSSKETRASNALIDDETAPRVAVFIGGTSGIGKATIKALVSTRATTRIYMIGRKSSEESSRAFIQELSAINSRSEAIWVEGEVSLLADVRRVCGMIKGKESHIDLLFLATGYAPFSGRKETAEGIEIVQSLEYYSRVLFVLHFLPLLNKAKAPRIVSVLAGGLEGSNVDLDDIDLRKPGNFGVMKSQMQYTAMKTMTFEKLATENPNVTFLHSWPGWVNTGNVRKGLDPNSVKAWVAWLFLEPLIYLLGYTEEESGQRHLFQCTSAAFGGRGTLWTGKAGMNSFEKQENGLFLVNYKCDCTLNAKILPILRERSQAKIWAHTRETLGPYL